MAQALDVMAGLGLEGSDGGGVAAMDGAGAGAAGAAFGRPGSGAEAAMEAAAAVGHGGLPAAAAAAGAGAATRGGQEVAGGGAIAQTAATGRGLGRNGRKDPMPSGEGVADADAEGSRAEQSSLHLARDERKESVSSGGERSRWQAHVFLYVLVCI